jgi:KDO2-lipid IV(A) lauroyltransferase
MLYYLIYKLTIFLAKLLPRKMGYGLAAVIADIFYIIKKKNRAVLRKNLEIILGTGDRRIRLYTRRIIRNFAYYLLDFLRFSRVDKEFVSRYVEVEGRENLDKALAYARGAIGISAHLGNWEFSGAVTAQLTSVPVNAVVWTHRNRWISRLFIRRRRASGISSIPLEQSVRLSLKALKRREIVGIIGDVNFVSPQSGVRVELFKRRAYLPEGPAVLALKTGAPIFCGFLTRRPENRLRYRMIYSEPFYPVSTGNLQADVQHITQQIAARIEKAIAQHPQQWFMVNNIWCD